MFTADFIGVDGEELELGNSADMLVEEESASFFEDLTDVVLLLGGSEGHGGKVRSVRLSISMTDDPTPTLKVNVASQLLSSVTVTV